MNEVGFQSEEKKLSLPTLTPRYVSPAMNYPSANKYGMFSKT